MTRIAEHYELMEAVGQGGMGDVFRGRDTDSGDIVAIKRLKSGLRASDPAFLDRFIREAEILQRLDHPNIVKILAVDEVEGEHYFVMEFLPESLADRLAKEGRLSPNEAMALGLELADALTRAHHLGVVHRDIKPANVLVSEDGTPRLSDFGAAQTVGSDLTGTGAVVGTIGYVSPESLEGQAPTPLNDIWAFGIMLYEILAGRRPFAAAEPAAEMLSILKAHPKGLEELCPEAPVALIDLIHRMLAKRPAERIPSMRQVGADLERLLTGSDTPAPTHESLASAQPTAEISTPIRRHNLPTQPTPFVGRDRELDAIAQRLRQDGLRILTVLGAGGIGKSRLVLEVAKGQLDHFPDGVFHVALVAASDPALVIARIADAVSFSFSGPESPRQQLLGYLENRRVLLVLDGAEHAHDTAPILSEMVERARGVVLLVASRERLNVRAEAIFVCGGMDVPTAHDLDVALHSGAVSLFVASAKRARPEFEIEQSALSSIVRICDRVQGMPLAIELAAAWIEMLEPTEILDEIDRSLDFLSTELRDVPERHRSVRAAFESSWTSLDADERHAMTLLAVFRGGFDREAAQAVSDASLRTLSRLVNKSLIKRHATGRYEQHELLRQNAFEKLDAESAGIAQKSHCDYYGSFTARFERHLKGARQKEALESMGREFENIRAAWDWAVKHRAVDELEPLIESLYRFFDMRSRFSEGEALFAEGANALSTDAPELFLSRVRARGALFTLRLGRYREARQQLETSLEKLRILNARGEVAFCLHNLADVASVLGEFEKSRALSREGLEVSRSIEDRAGIATALNNLGVAAYHSKDLEDAERCYRESLEISREIGDAWGTTFALNNLGVLAHELARYEEARGLYGETLLLCEEMGDAHGAAAARINLAEVHQALGQTELARASLTDGLEMARRLGDKWSVTAALTNLGKLQRDTGALDDARTALEEAIRTARAISAGALEVESAEALVNVLALTGQSSEALALLSRAEAHPSADTAARARLTQLRTELESTQ